MEQEARFPRQFDAKLLNGISWEVTSELEICEHPTLSDGSLGILLDCTYEKLVVAVDIFHRFVHIKEVCRILLINASVDPK